MTLSERSVVRFDQVLLLILVAGVFATAIWAAQPYAVGVFHDDGVYVVLAKALASGEGYRYLNLPDAPVATHYPPAYPLLLAALWKFAPEFPRNIIVFQVANAVLLALSAWGVAAFARRVLGWRLAAAIVVAIAATVSYPLLGLSGHLLSETLFAAVLMLALILAERAAANGSTTRDVWIAAAVGALLTLVRTHGIAIIAALVVLLLMRRRTRQAGYVAIAALVVLLPWQLWIVMNDGAIVEPLRGKYASYGPWLLDGLRGGIGFVWGTFANNVREVIALFADRFSLSDHALPRQVTGVVVAAALLVGGFGLRRRAPVTVLFAALYIVVLLVWPFNPWRFLYAAWPVVVILLGGAVHLLYEHRPRNMVVANLGLVMLTILVLGAIRQDSRAYQSRAWYHPAQRAASAIGPVVRWVAENTAPQDVVAVDAEQIVYLFTGRRAVPPAPFTAAEYVTPPSTTAAMKSLQHLITHFPVAYVATVNPPVLVSAHRLIADTATQPRRPRLVQVQSLGHGAVFRVERDTPATPGTHE